MGERLIAGSREGFTDDSQAPSTARGVSRATRKLLDFAATGHVSRCGDDGPQPRQDGFLSLTALRTSNRTRLQRALRRRPWNAECVSPTTEGPSDIPPLWRDDRGPPPGVTPMSRRWIEPFERL
jgi:hypothetical protein